MLNWFGDWSTGALYQVGKEFTNKIDLEKTNVSVPAVSYFIVQFVITLLFYYICVHIDSKSTAIILIVVLFFTANARA